MKLIDKDVLVAEIESRIKSMEECFNGKFPMSQSVKETEQDKGKLAAYKSICSFIDTLEVTEVDLEKELSTYLEVVKATDEDIDFVDFAKHFFELGLNASNPLTDANLDSMQEDYVSLLESRGMKHEEAVIASASYANGVNDVLKRFKAQKGKKL